VAVFYDLMVERHNQMGTWDNARGTRQGGGAEHGGADEILRRPDLHDDDVRVDAGGDGRDADVQPGLESVRTYSFEEKFYRKLFFKDDRLVGAIMIGPPKGRKKLIEIMRSRNKIERPKQELLDRPNLKDQ